MISATLAACGSSGVDRSSTNSPAAARFSEALNVATRNPPPCGTIIESDRRTQTPPRCAGRPATGRRRALYPGRRDGAVARPGRRGSRAPAGQRARRRGLSTLPLPGVVDEQALVEAAAEVGIPAAAVHRALAVEQLDPLPRARPADRLVGAAVVAVDAELTGSAPDVLARLDAWFVEGHHLHRHRVRGGRGEWTMRTRPRRSHRSARCVWRLVRGASAGCATCG